MNRLIPIALLALAACDDRAPEPAAPLGPAPVAGAEVPVATVTEAPDLAAPRLVPDAGKGVKGARNVLLEWARALERRDFARADAQWGAGAGEAGSAARFAKFRTITVALGEGAVEGGAGSLYYEVPVTVTGEGTDGSPQKFAGSVTVRRVNDVDGASAAQLRWHLAGLNLAG